MSDPLDMPAVVPVMAAPVMAAPAAKPAAEKPAAKPAERLPVSMWRKTKGTSVFVYTITAHKNNWSTSAQTDETAVTEAVYDAAVAAVRNIRIG